MEDLKIKKQVIEKIKSSTNILVTVSNNPSVDALSAALALTLSLDKLKKYATAVYSGATPPAISFLEPEKTFEENTDSLRDFIIALNKEKADHLRFKPEGDLVKIYITPYRTKISPEDLEFSQGDFNVELVIALGVDVQEHLDAALDGHGNILHDASVVTMTVGDQVSSLGGIDWHDAQSTSLSEMVGGLVDGLKEDDKTPLIDAPIATALLTGIVAQTERFSNALTTSHVMTMAAQLMAAGADQQLVATKLQEGEATPVTQSNSYAADEPAAAAEVMEITHEEPVNAYGIEEAPETPLEPASAPLEPTVPAVEAPVEAPADASRAYVAEPSPESAYALEAETPVADTPQGFPGAPEVAPGSVAVNDVPLQEIAPSNAYILGDTPEEPASEAPVVPEAPAAPVEPVAPLLADGVLPMPPPLPDFSQAFPIAPPPVLPVEPNPQPQILGDILAPEPQTTPEVAPQPAPEAPVAPVPPTPPANPGQFQIPPQA